MSAHRIRWLREALPIATLIVAAHDSASLAHAQTDKAPGAEQTVVQEVVAQGEAIGQPAAATDEPEPLSQSLETWLREVDPLITRAEREAFMKLARNYQRTAFIRQFWRVRDPFPRTTRNELKERWPLRVAEARSRFGNLDEDRARVLLLHDRPDGTLTVRCTTTRIPAEVWFYRQSDVIDFPFALVFVQPSEGRPLRIWDPTRSGGLSVALQRARGCINGGRMLQFVNALAADPDDYALTLRRVLAKPKLKSEEWIDTFVAQTTELPADTPRLDAETRFAFLGRYQQRTVVQGLVSVAAEDVAVSAFEDFRSHDLRLVGEVLRGEELLESFVYSFGFPAVEEPSGEPLPLAFERYLRPGAYRVVLRIDDLASDAAYRSETKLKVPAMDRAFVPLDEQNPLTTKLFAEAIAAIASGETSIKIHRPRAPLLTGFVRFDVLAAGDEITKVRFLLDDRPVVIKNRPPWNVGVDVGPTPDLHVLRVEGLDEAGDEVAADEILINGGGSRFAIKLIEPRRGRKYQNSLRVRLEAEIPDGRSLDRIEIFLDERRVATLYQEPFVHPVLLPDGQDVAYVRAVAYLPDGNTTEDLVFLGDTAFAATVDVRMVELYTSVLDPEGRPVAGLGKERFEVFEDGVKQTVRRFETVADLPIHIGVLIDNSASMHGVLSDVRKAALTFFQAITPRDRAAVITFNSFPNLAVELTNDRGALGNGLAGLVAEGRTALYDSLMFGLYYLTGIRGQRALLVLSDGKDESSRFSFEETLDYARRAGITVYAIGLRLTDGAARRKLTRLADETGGRSFFLARIEDLEAAYSTIERELRSQYLIAYQSSNTTDDETFRTVTLEVDRPNVSVKTLSGYYP